MIKKVGLTARFFCMFYAAKALTQINYYDKISKF